MRNSGDTAGPRDHVVGYGAYAFFEPAHQGLDLESRRHLLGIAARSIRHGFKRGKACDVDLGSLPPALGERRASFVTLESDGRLRGCIGSLEATRPLAADVAHNARAAASADPRFPPVEKDELEGLGIKISVLSSPEPMRVESEADLVARLRPGIDGLIIKDRDKRATFLPSVWKGIPEPARFVRELAREGRLADGTLVGDGAGLALHHGRVRLRAMRRLARSGCASPPMLIPAWFDGAGERLSPNPATWRRFA